MKTRKNKLLDSVLLILFLVALGGLGYGLYYYLAGAPEGAVEAAAPDDADAVFYVHFQNLNESAFGRAMEEEEENVPAEFEGFLESLGVRRDDIIEGLFAVRNLGAAREQRLQDAGLSGALRLASPLTLDRLEEALSETLDETQRGNLRRSTIEDYPVLEFPAPDLGGNLAAAVFEREDDGTTLYFGDGSSLRTTLTKLESRSEKELPEAIRAGRDELGPDGHAWFVAALSPALQNELRNALQASPIQLGPVGDALGTLQRAGLGVRAASDLNLRLALAFGSPEHAASVRDTFNQNIVPMLQMTAQSEMESLPPGLENLQAEANGSTVRLSLSLSADAARNLVEAAEGRGAGPAVEPEPAPSAGTAAGDTGEPEQEGWPELRIENVLVSTGEAIINGELIPQGEEIEGVTLYEVDEDGVILQRNREFRFVAVGDSVGPGE